MRLLYGLLYCLMVSLGNCYGSDAPIAQDAASVGEQEQSPTIGQIPAAPVANTVAQRQDSASTAPEEAEIKGIDTADLDEPQGNWLFKRMWWQRAEAQYEKTKALVETIMESRLAFFAKRTEWDKTIFDPFYMEIGVGRGILEELITHAIEQLNEERSKQGELNQEERDLLASFQAEKSTLEQLQKDIQQINQIDSAIDDAITALIGQINATRNFEKQSWQNFKKIAQELSDKNARDLYYGMATYWQNINDIGSYIQTPFAQYFEQLGNAARDQIAKVNDSLKALKEKGIDLKKHWQDVEAKQQAERTRARDAQEYDLGVQEGMAKAVHEEKEIKKEEGFFSKIVHGISSALSTTVGYVTTGFKSIWDFTLGRFFAGSDKAAKAAAYEAKQLEHDGQEAAQ